MGRPYTGWNGDAAGKRAGTEKFVQLLSEHFNNGVWNNGTWNVRPARGSGKPSVHGTGRAADLSWRKNGNKGFGDYNTALQVVNFLVANAEVLLVEEIHDYFLKPHGRGWRCDRSAWKVYDKPTIGTPGGDWWHVEIAPAHADDPAYYEKVFAGLKGKAISAAPASNGPLAFAFPGTPLKKGSKGDAVKLVQSVIGLKADGDFGPKTEEAIKVWQKSRQLNPDGVIDAEDWDVMF
jgi:hypothetical protein